MSQGPHKELEAAVAKPAVEQPTQPNWNVQHKEVLDHIRQERATQAEVKTVAQVQAQQAPQHRPEVHPPVAQPQSQVRHDGAPQQIAHPPVRPDVTPPQIAQNHPQRRDVTPQQIAQGAQRIGQGHGLGNHNQPTEINRTVINNNTRNDYGSSNNQNKYLYGGLAGGALLGGGAAYYANRDSDGYGYGRDYDSGLNLNLGFTDPYSNLNNGYGDQYSQYGQSGQYNQYDLYNNATRYNDQYSNGNQYSDNGPIYDPNGGNDGGTTYGGTQFDNGFVSRPIYETTNGYGYPPAYGYERRNSFGDNPIAAVPALFGNLIGGLLGNLTNPHRGRYDNDDY
jgi:hypothetical protein